MYARLDLDLFKVKLVPASKEDGKGSGCSHELDTVRKEEERTRGGRGGGQPAATWFQREPDPTAPTFSDGTSNSFLCLNSLGIATFRNQIVLQ